jgi:RimJ/RimL family protein N-acetyltransferase
MEGQLVVVEPLAAEHEAALLAAGHDEEVWRYLTAFPDAFETPERFHRWMQDALAETAAGREGAWAIIDRQSGAPIGSTRYLALRPEHCGLEIGWTWLGDRGGEPGRTSRRSCCYSIGRLRCWAASASS